MQLNNDGDVMWVEGGCRNLGFHPPSQETIVS